MVALQAKSDTRRTSIQDYSEDNQAHAAVVYAAAMAKFALFALFALFAQIESEKSMAFRASKSDAPPA